MRDKEVGEAAPTTERLRTIAVISILAYALEKIRGIALDGDQDANFTAGLLCTAIALLQAGDRGQVNRLAGVLLEYGFELEGVVEMKRAVPVPEIFLRDLRGSIAGYADSLGVLLAARRDKIGPVGVGLVESVRSGLLRLNEKTEGVIS